MPLVKFDNVSVSYYVPNLDPFGRAKAAKKIKDPDEGESNNAFVGGVIAKHRLYTEVQALIDISITANSGDRIGLVGVNGSGKSTFLKTCIGQLAPHTGKVSVEGKGAGLLALGAGLKAKLSGRKNVELKGLYHGLTKSDLPALVEEAKQISGLGDFFEMPISTYSTGMITRLTMSFLTLVEGDILILDEWVGTGDATVTDQANDLQERLLKSSTILVIASHSESVLRSWTDQLIWLHQGKIEGFGKTDDILPEYQYFVRGLKNRGLLT